MRLPTLQDPRTMQALLLATIYPGLLHAHIALVSLSGGFFALRWLAVLAGQHWPMQVG